MEKGREILDAKVKNKVVKGRDRNTKYFHQSTMQRRRRNKVLSLKRDDGIWVDEERRIMENFQSFFEKLFETKRNRDCGDVLEIIPKLVSDEMNKELIMDVCEKEVMQATFKLGAMKALRPDGFNCVFYQKYWGIV